MLNKLRDEIHQNAVAHGWWDEPRSFGEIIALCHSELSEALEEFRNGHKPNEIYYNCTQNPALIVPCAYSDEECRECGLANITCEVCEYKECKPEGIPIELADCIIRILDYCGKENIDIEQAIQIKNEYNKSRPYRHGNKVI